MENGLEETAVSKKKGGRKKLTQKTKTITVNITGVSEVKSPQKLSRKKYLPSIFLKKKKALNV